VISSCAVAAHWRIGFRSTLNYFQTKEKKKIIFQNPILPGLSVAKLFGDVTHTRKLRS